MAKQQTDEELNLRRKARRRLIGAVALTLVVVVILPMVLDSEPKSTGNNIDLSIPDPDKVPRLTVSESAAISPSAASAAATGTAPPAHESNAGKPAVAQSQPEKVAPGNAQSAPGKSAGTRSTGKPDNIESYAAQVGAYANADTAKQELKKLKKWGFKAYTEKVGDNVRVRVGPYKDRSKVEKVIKLLEKHGMHPVIVSAK